jgi:hypothetical protein
MLMEATVTELLREFPRLRRAALAGEMVIIKSREGDLQLARDATKLTSLIGALQGQIVHSADDIDRPTTSDADLGSSL